MFLCHFSHSIFFFKDKLKFEYAEKYYFRKVLLVICNEMIIFQIKILAFYAHIHTFFSILSTFRRKVDKSLESRNKSNLILIFSFGTGILK